MHYTRHRYQTPVAIKVLGIFISDYYVLESPDSSGNSNWHFALFTLEA